MDKCVKCIHSDTSTYGILCSICDRKVDDDGNCLDFEEEIKNEIKRYVDTVK